MAAKKTAKKTAAKKTAAKKPAAKKTAAKKTAAKKPAAKLESKTTWANEHDPKRFAPGKLVVHDDGKLSLIYTDFPDDEGAFEEHGLQGGGYTWHGLVEHLLKKASPEVLEALEFDPEGSMFAVVGTLDALEQVGRALSLLEDVTLLRKLAATVDLSEYD